MNQRDSRVPELAIAKTLSPRAGLTDQQQPATRLPASLRAVLIGFSGIPLSTYWMVLTYWRCGLATGTHCPICSHCFSVLPFLAGTNALVRHRRPGRAFSIGEMLSIIYVILLVAADWCQY